MKKSRQLCGLLLAGAILTTSLAPVTVNAAAWKKDSAGWWYQEDNGSWPANQWKMIGGQWYWFQSNGYMATGWKYISGNWYYFQPSGAMMGEGWHVINGSWYYMYSSGAMAADTWIGDSYVNASGAWVQGKKKNQSVWLSSGGRWWYRHADGSYTKNGWEKIDGSWYLFDSYGWMLTGWQYVGGNWYYMYSNGAMATNTWIDGYYVNEQGVWCSENLENIDVSEYLNNYDVLVNRLNMKETHYWQFPGSNSYTVDNFYLEWEDDVFSMKNEGARYVQLYGIGLGDSAEQADEILQNNSWRCIYTTNNLQKYLLSTGRTNYMVELYLTDRKVSSWYLNNWPEGVDVSETKYEYASGEFVSTFRVDGDQAMLMFWHNYGLSSSDEEFMFEWNEGQNQYEVLGLRSEKRFKLVFNKNKNGMQISVTCLDGNYFSWTTGTSSSTWINASYVKK